nr:hypothetical protein [Pseudomonas luteola]
MANSVIAARPTFNLLKPDKADCLFIIALSLLFTETFSGALRYYLDQAGLAALLYLPKAACLSAALLELFYFRASRTVWVVLFFLPLSAALALVHGATIENLIFALFIYAPFLFGLLCGSYLAQRSKWFGWIVAGYFLASLAGIGLDLLTTVPWKGYSYSVGGNELSANKAWSADGTDRLAGFSRMSTSLAMMIALYALYLNAVLRSTLLRIILFVAAFGGIFLSTNKSIALAYLITFAFLCIRPLKLISAAGCLCIIGIGMSLPVISQYLNLDGYLAYTTSSTASFYDRLINTWPNFIKVMSSEGFLETGAGIGAVGSSGAGFPIAGLEIFGVADNTVLYLWGTFGLLGFVLWSLLLPLLMRLSQAKNRFDVSLYGTTLCICLVAWTTDIPEVVCASLFLGIAVSRVLTANPAHDRMDLNPI